MPLLKIKTAAVRPSFSLGDDDAIDFLKALDPNKYVPASIALQNSDVYSLITQLSADLSLVKYQADTDRMQSLIDNPSKTSNGFSFWQSMFAQMLLAGNAYAYRWRNVNGVDLYWEFLRPSQVQPQLLEDGSGMVYNATFDEPSVGFVENIPQSDMIHLRLMSKNGGLTGISPLTALSSELNIKNSSNDLTLNALKKSVNAPGILTVQGGGLLDAKKKSAVSRRFVKQVDNSDGGPLVLDDLETYQPLEVKGDVAKLLAQVDWTGKQIAKVYGVPDSYINGQGDQQSSITQIGDQYAKAINRFVAPIKSEFENKLNTSIDPDIRPAIDAMGDGFANTIGSLISNGTIAKNQGRWILQQYGYLPKDLPTADTPPAPIQQTQPDEGGDSEDEEDRNQGTSD